MDGAAVKELSERLIGPKVVEDKIALPRGWTLTHPSKIASATPEPLAVYTLGAVRDYVTANRDALALDRVVAHVVSPQVVRLQGPLHETGRARECYVQATAQSLIDGFLGKYMSIEEFLIGMQSRFVETDDRSKILRLFASVKHETVKQAQDDGLTQVVTAKSGVALVTDVAVPNPVTLTPFRTFREVLQPVSAFVLRVQASHGGGLPNVGLFEADGGAWRLVAVDRVRDWLVEALPKDVAVLA